MQFNISSVAGYIKIFVKLFIGGYIDCNMLDKMAELKQLFYPVFLLKRFSIMKMKV